MDDQSAKPTPQELALLELERTPISAHLAATPMSAAMERALAELQAADAERSAQRLNLPPVDLAGSLRDLDLDLIAGCPRCGYGKGAR